MKGHLADNFPGMAVNPPPLLRNSATVAQRDTASPPRGMVQIENVLDLTADFSLYKVVIVFITALLSLTLVTSQDKFCVDAGSFTSFPSTATSPAHQDT